MKRLPESSLYIIILLLTMVFVLLWAIGHTQEPTISGVVIPTIVYSDSDDNEIEIDVYDLLETIEKHKLITAVLWIVIGIALFLLRLELIRINRKIKKLEVMK